MAAVLQFQHDPLNGKTELKAVSEADIWLQACYTTLAAEELAWNGVWSPERASTVQTIARYSEGLKRMKKKNHSGCHNDPGLFM